MNENLTNVETQTMGEALEEVTTERKPKAGVVVLVAAAAVGLGVLAVKGVKKLVAKAKAKKAAQAEGQTEVIEEAPVEGE